MKVCVCVCVSMHVCMGVERGKPGRRCEIRMAQLHPELRILKCMGGRRQEQDQSIPILGKELVRGILWSEPWEAAEGQWLPEKQGQPQAKRLEQGLNLPRA